MNEPPLKHGTPDPMKQDRDPTSPLPFKRAGDVEDKPVAWRVKDFADGWIIFRTGDGMPTNPKHWGPRARAFLSNAKEKA